MTHGTVLSPEGLVIKNTDADIGRRVLVIIVHVVLVRCAVALTEVFGSQYLEIRKVGAVLRVIDVQNKVAVDAFEGWEILQEMQVNYLLPAGEW